MRTFTTTWGLPTIAAMRLSIVVLLLTAALATPILARGRAEPTNRGVEATNARVGSPLVVHSRIYHSTAKITLVKVIDPATPSYPSKLRPRQGDRWIAIRIRIRGLHGIWIDTRPASREKSPSSRMAVAASTAAPTAVHVSA